MIKGHKVHMENPIAAAVTFACAYRQEVKVTSTEYHVHAVTAAGEVMTFGDLANGFEINIFTDPDFTKSVDTTDPFIGSPVYTQVHWKVKEVQTIADFYVKECSVEVAGVSMELIKDNCYSEIFGTKQLQPKKRVSDESKFKFTSFIVGDGKSEMEVKVTCTVTICSLEEDKCDSWLNDENSECPTDDEMLYRAKTYTTN